VFLNLGYAVDVIEWSDSNFLPRKRYAYFLDIGKNMERLTSRLNTDCIKILHITHADAEIQNKAEHDRIMMIEKDRGIRLATQRTIPETRGILFADTATALSDGWSLTTYAYANKKISIIPISTTHTFPSPSTKNFTRARAHFLWYGGGGAALKGLDVLLVAFSEMPEYTLTICGKAGGERDFAKTFRKELFETQNIKVVGHIDPGGAEFRNIYENSIALVHPSFSEGASGSVILAMHAGLIPIVSHQSSVHIDDFGIELKENTVKEIKGAVQKIASLSDAALQERAEKTWRYARTHHTREQFAETYRAFIISIEEKEKNRSY